MRPTAVLAFGLLTTYALVNVAALWLAFVSGESPAISELPASAVFAPLTIVGTLVALREPRNPVGWLLITAGLVVPFLLLCELYAAYRIAGGHGGEPLTLLAAWLSFWVWIGLLGSLLFAVLLFPTGRLASPRWRPAAWFSGALLSFVGIVFALSPAASDVHPQVVNPIGIEAMRPLWQLVEESFWLYLAFFGVAVASVVQRFRIARGVERQQLKWAAAGFAVAGVALAASDLSPEPWSNPLWILAMVAVPGAIGIAIMRYRLYDIDLLINRTLVYGGTSVALVAIYIAALLALQVGLRQVAVGSELAIAGSTLFVAGLVQPARARIQRAVDRHFYRDKYDAQKTLDAFAYRLRDQVDLDELRSELLGVVHETMRPAHASLWLRSRG